MSSKKEMIEHYGIRYDHDLRKVLLTEREGGHMHKCYGTVGGYNIKLKDGNICYFRYKELKEAYPALSIPRKAPVYNHTITEIKLTITEDKGDGIYSVIGTHKRREEKKSIWTKLRELYDRL